MNPLERLRAVIRFQEVDRPCVIPELIGVTATLTGAPIKEYVTSGTTLAQCQLAAQQMIGHDAVFAMADLCVEAEAIGCHVKYPDDNYPYVVKPAIKDYSELSRLSLPNPRADGRMPQMLKAVRTLKAAVGGRIPVMGHVTGPITLASRIMDIEKMLYLIVDHPDRFAQMLEFCKQVSIQFALELLKEGADGIIVFDPAASPAVLPAKIFRQFEKNPVKSIFSAVREERPDIITWYSVAGPVQTNFEILKSVSADIFTIDYVVPLDLAMNHSGFTVINGNIKPMTFLEGTGDEIQAEAARLLVSARPLERFILGSGCEIPLNSPAENIRALVRAAEAEARSFDRVNQRDSENVEITILPHRKKIFVPKGSFILDAAQKANVAVTTRCDKSGSCGKCVVRVKDGDVSPPETIETLHLRDMEGTSGQRLACRARALGDAGIYVPYFSRVFKSRIVSLDGSAQCDMSAELSRSGFSPNITTKLLRLPEMTASGIPSYEEWAAKSLSPARIDARAIGTLSSLITGGASDIFAVMDVTQGEVIDFSPTSAIYGLAVDMGTTTITAYAHNLATGELKCAASMGNPQSQWGSDVITRVSHVARDPSMTGRLQAKLIEGVNGLIEHFHREGFINQGRIYEMVVVGNPIITHLFLGLNPESLSKAPFIPTVSRRVSTSAEALRSKIHLAVNPSCRVEIPPSVGGFVGSDAVAGILATGMYDDDEACLFIDIGTNGEVAAGNRHRLMSVSVAAGPAFEGLHAAEGRGSQNGVIQRISMNADGEVKYELMGGSAPLGLNGSSVIDAVAGFIRLGVIDGRGKFVNRDRWPQMKDDVFILLPKDKTALHSPIYISAPDIVEIQKAKSAFKTGITLALKGLGMTPSDVRKVFISGLFGSSINVDNAKRIGMFPEFPNARFVTMRNSAGLGARILLLSVNARRDVERIAGITEHMNLANHAQFMNLFIENMLFPASS
jgi:MtaA/CmuA family methyltransferase